MQILLPEQFINVNIICKKCALETVDDVLSLNIMDWWKGRKYYEELSMARAMQVLCRYKFHDNGIGMMCQTMPIRYQIIWWIVLHTTLHSPYHKIPDEYNFIVLKFDRPTFTSAQLIRWNSRRNRTRR